MKYLPLILSGIWRKPGRAVLIFLQVAEIGMAWALVIGLIGGLLPALRAARVSVTTALRAT
jgi:ABC-type antimicrobial peptide transport system permease subunit